jgi:hypothetical protein
VKKFLVSGAGVAAALVMVFGTAPAGAVNEYVDMTYEKASAQISHGGRTPVIATRVGDYLSTDQCIVIGSRSVKGGKTLLNLNCNGGTALDGHPGNSVASPEGQKALLTKDRATRMSLNYEKSLKQGKTPSCFIDKGSTNWCIDICTKSRACSDELNEALGL